jgi:hypothetical protein
MQRGTDAVWQTRHYLLADRVLDAASFSTVNADPNIHLRMFRAERNVLLSGGCLLFGTCVD